jgi:hypothetical protein
VKIKLRSRHGPSAAPPPVPRPPLRVSAGRDYPSGYTDPDVERFACEDGNAAVHDPSTWGENTHPSYVHVVNRGRHQGDRMTPEQTLAAVYHNMLALADTHVTLDVEPDLDGLNPRERAFVELGVDIGWTATVETLRDLDLLAKETP